MLSVIIWEIFSNCHLFRRSHSVTTDHQICMGCFKSYPLSQIDNHQCNSLLQTLDVSNQGKTLDAAPTEGEFSYQVQCQCCHIPVVQIRNFCWITVTELRDKVSLILPPYSCNYCNVTYETYLRLKQHLLQSHDATVCESCNLWVCILTYRHVNLQLFC